ncbi:MAG: prolyl oligopeptidase family serine peptidase [Butyrivibrio sp.]|nr:prolyl oligopeptidase family serine peptidase [Butyrivibrio sp.]
MKLPPDWDKPSEENKDLCEKFIYETFDYSGTLPYRLFVPDSSDKVPLVLYLHGADAYGNDNELQLTMHDIGTVFARDDWQKQHPCFVCAPQCDVGSRWSNLITQNKVCALIKSLRKKYSNIDDKRIYIYGYSAGGVGCFEILKYHPGIFAAAVPICGATGWENIRELTKTPIWMIHAADDMVVKATYKTDGFSAHLGSRDIYDELKDIHTDLHYTEYKTGEMKERYGINPHCSWVPAGQDNEVKEWMFSKPKI